MISLKRLITFVTVLFTIWTSSAQELLNLIPKDATFVGMVNVEKIKTKADFEELIKLAFVKKMDREIAKELSRNLIKADSSNYLDLRKFGINVNSKSYFYFVNSEKMYYGALLLNIINKDKFTEFVKVISGDLNGENIFANKDYLLSHHKDLNILWNNNKAVLFGATLNKSYKDSIEAKIKLDIDNEENQAEENQNYNYKFYDLKNAAIDSIQKKWFKDNTASFFKNKGANSYANNVDFKNYIKSKPDAAFTFNYGAFSNMNMKSVLGYSPKWFNKSFPYKYLMSLSEGVKLFSKIELEKDAVEIKFDIKYNKKVSDMFSKVKKKKISKNFLKYMNKDLMGYYAIGADVEGISEGIKEIFRNAMPDVAEYGKTASATMDIIDVIIDEKALYKIFTRDAVIAVNGVKEFEVIHKSYEFDEDFKKTEVVKPSKEKMPEIVIMIGVGNKEDVNKLINLLISLKALKKEGNVYSVDIKKNKFPVHLRITDNILFISNNKAYVNKPVVFEKSKQLHKDHSKIFKKNTFVSYANTAVISRYFADTEGYFKEKKISTETSNFLKDIKMYGYGKGTYMHTKYIFQLFESEDNSISDVLKFINKLYLYDQNKL